MIPTITLAPTFGKINFKGPVPHDDRRRYAGYVGEHILRDHRLKEMTGYELSTPKDENTIEVTLKGPLSDDQRRIAKDLAAQILRESTNVGFNISGR
ncbi:MAG: hypothetical protein AB7P76_00830 [Candidatus Melainabacteria bacterium]